MAIELVMKSGRTTPHYSGNSYDIKPTKAINVGSTLHENDTGKEFVFTRDEQWVEVTADPSALIVSLLLQQNLMLEQIRFGIGQLACVDLKEINDE